MPIIDTIQEWLGIPSRKGAALSDAKKGNHFAQAFKGILNKAKPKKSSNNGLPTYKGLSVGDIQDWGTFINEGRLAELDEASAGEMLLLLARLGDKVEAFLKDHKRALETGERYEDQFKEALNNYITNMSNQIQTLTEKAQNGLMTEDDLSRLETLSVILGQQSRLGSKIPPKKNSPQEQLLNNLGVWEKKVHLLQERYGMRPAPSGPTPSGPRPAG